MSQYVDYWRQLDIFDPSKFSGKVVVVGAGSVGSFVTLSLAKMGIKNITVIDFDKVENHNLPNQFYRLSDVGKPKVEALKEIVKDFTGADITTINDKFESTDLDVADILIVTVDSMKARHNIFEKIKVNPYIKYLIDVRTSAEQFRIYTIDKSNFGHVEFYEKELYTDEEASELPCTARNIVYTVEGVASFVCSKVKKIMLNQSFKKLIIFDFVTGVKMNGG